MAARDRARFHTGRTILNLTARFIDDFPQSLPWPEMGNAFGIKLYRLSGPRVAADMSNAGTGAECSETPDLDTTAVDQLLGNSVKKGAYDRVDFTRA